jgi:hypothetical protein
MRRRCNVTVDPLYPRPRCQAHPLTFVLGDSALNRFLPTLTQSKIPAANPHMCGFSA